VKEILERLETRGSVFCGSSVTVIVMMGMVVIAKLGYLNGWMIWKTGSNNPLML
jgi:hypothetical protein